MMRISPPAAALAPLLVLAGFVSVAAQDTPRDGTPRKDKDPYAGKTVRDGRDGMALLRHRERRVPKVGQLAPDFALKTPDGKRTIRLSSFRGKRPVVLVFGSLT